MTFFTCFDSQGQLIARFKFLGKLRICAAADVRLPVCMR